MCILNKLKPIFLSIALLTATAATAEVPNNNAMFIGGSVISKADVKGIFHALTVRLGSPLDIIDVLKIDDELIAIAYLDKGVVKTAFSDGTNLIEKPVPKNSNPFLSDEYLDKISSHYQPKTANAKPFVDAVSKAQHVKVLSPVVAPIKTPPNSGFEAYEPSSAEKFDKKVRELLLKTEPVAMFGLDKSKPNLIVFLSKDCVHCLHFIEDAHQNKDKFAPVNLVFIPIGAAGDTNKQWSDFFGVSLDFDESVYEKNTAIFSEIANAAGQHGGTPSNLWVSTENGGNYEFVVGRIGSENIKEIRKMMVTPTNNK